MVDAALLLLWAVSHVGQSTNTAHALSTRLCCMGGALCVPAICLHGLRGCMLTPPRSHARCVWPLAHCAKAHQTPSPSLPVDVFAAILLTPPPPLPPRVCQAQAPPACLHTHTHIHTCTPLSRPGRARRKHHLHVGTHIYTHMHSCVFWANCDPAGPRTMPRLRARILRRPGPRVRRHGRAPARRGSRPRPRVGVGVGVRPAGRRGRPASGAGGARGGGDKLQRRPLQLRRRSLPTQPCARQVRRPAGLLRVGGLGWGWVQ